MRNLISNSNIDFMKLTRPAWIGSGVLIVLSLLFILFRGLNFGLDFTGGYIIEVGYPQAADLNDIRQTLSNGEFP